jgi:Flp pilus assembly protein TadG
MKNRHRIRGSSMAETAFVMVALLTILFGTIDFGRLIYTWTWLQNIANRAARWEMVRGANCTRLTDCNDSKNTKYINTYIQGLAQGIVNPSLITISPNWDSTGPNSNQPGSSGLFVLYLTYPFNFLLPYLPKDSFSFSAASRMHFTN